jgi:NTE family protein
VAIGKLLAKLHKKKVGLVLGSGAARGMAHIGVLNALEKAGIPIDMIAGTSVGAVVGSLYARLLNAAYIKDIALELGIRQWAQLIDPSVSRNGLIKGRRIKDLLKLNMGGDVRFSDLKIPFACVATDIVTGEEVVFDRGLVLDAVRASFSLPAIFTPVKLAGRYLMDGGIVNPVPVSVARQMGADFVIAVNVIHDIKNETEDTVETRKKEPNILHVIMQSIYIAAYAMIKSTLAGADVVIEPRVRHIGYGEFHRAREAIARGELAAANAIPRIKEKLGR